MNKNKYESLTKEDAIALLEKYDKELKRKEYGLVWDCEKEPEKVVEDCKQFLPVLKEDKSKHITTGQEQDNILIEGDNYHALQVLSYTHKGKIDVIYIDPPYNTGNKDFVYNDRFVDKEDGNVNITSADETNKTSTETWNDVGTSFGAKANIMKANASMSATIDTESHKQVDTSTTQKSSDIKSDGSIEISGKNNHTYIFKSNGSKYPRKCR